MMTFSFLYIRFLRVDITKTIFDGDEDRGDLARETSTVSLHKDVCSTQNIHDFCLETTIVPSTFFST